MRLYELMAGCLVLCLAACGGPGETPALQPTASSPSETNTPTVSTRTPIVSATASTTPSASKISTATTELTIWKRLVEGIEDRTVTGAFWSDDGKQLYYSFNVDQVSSKVNWFVHNIDANTSAPAPGLMRYNPNIWEQLKITNLASDWNSWDADRVG